MIGGIAELLEASGRAAARAVNALMTATYWEIGRRIVEFEQGGEKRVGYGEELLDRLADDLNARFGRVFSRRNLQSMRQFYQSLPAKQIWQTLSAKSSTVEERAPLPPELSEATIVQTLSAKSKVAQIRQTPSGKSSPFTLSDLARAFPLPGSHYALLINEEAIPAKRPFRTNQGKQNQPRNQNAKIHRNIDRLFSYARSQRPGGTGEPGEPEEQAKGEAGPEAASCP